MKLKIKIFELKVKSSYLGKQNFKKNSKNFFTEKNFVEKCEDGLNGRGKTRVKTKKLKKINKKMKQKTSSRQNNYVDLRLKVLRPKVEDVATPCLLTSRVYCASLCHIINFYSCIVVTIWENFVN